MNLPENDYQILKLTDAFYKAYPNPPYTEILKKIKEHIIVCYSNHIMIILSAYLIEVRLHTNMHITSHPQKELNYISQDSTIVR